RSSLQRRSGGRHMVLPQLSRNYTTNGRGHQAAKRSLGTYLNRIGRERHGVGKLGVFCTVQPYHSSALQGRQGKHLSVANLLSSQFYFFAQEWKIVGTCAARTRKAHPNVALG